MKRPPAAAAIGRLSRWGALSYCEKRADPRSQEAPVCRHGGRGRRRECGAPVPRRRQAPAPRAAPGGGLGAPLGDDGVGDPRRGGGALQGLVHGRPLRGGLRPRAVPGHLPRRHPLGAAGAEAARGPGLEAEQHRHPRQPPRGPGPLGVDAEGPRRPGPGPPLQGPRLVELRLGGAALRHLLRHLGRRPSLGALSGPPLPLPPAAGHRRHGSRGRRPVADDRPRGGALRRLPAGAARAPDERQPRLRHLEPAAALPGAPPRAGGPLQQHRVSVRRPLPRLPHPLRQASPAADADAAAAGQPRRASAGPGRRPTNPSSAWGRSASGTASRSCFTGAPPIAVGDRLFLYYRGTPRRHAKIPPRVRPPDRRRPASGDDVDRPRLPAPGRLRLGGRQLRRRPPDDAALRAGRRRAAGQRQGGPRVAAGGAARRGGGRRAGVRGPTAASPSRRTASTCRCAGGGPGACRSSRCGCGSTSSTPGSTPTGPPGTDPSPRREGRPDFPQVPPREPLPTYFSSAILRWSTTCPLPRRTT